MNINEGQKKALSEKYPHLHPISKEANERLKSGYLVEIDLDAIEEIAKGENMTAMQIIDSLMIKQTNHGTNK